MSPDGQPNTWDPPFVQWVVKLSKLCNLRCKYCYEFPYLGDPKHMQPEEIARMFQHIASSYRDRPRRMDFVWHGGEPLMQKPDYYLRIEELEHEIFDQAKIPFTNSIQTNLTRLDNGSLGLLKHFFKNVGVSIDLFGDQRVNIAGKPVQDRVLRNMQRLKEEGVAFGCITVLSRATLPYVEPIYHFFEEIDTSFRFLPIYRTGYAGQQDWLSLTAEEITGAFRKVVDLWFASDSYIQVRPVQDYIANILNYLNRKAGKPTRYYDKLLGEVVYIVDTNGDLYSNADAYDLSLCHGNLFQEPLETLRRSEGYMRAVARANERIAATCGSCRFYGACSGFFMGEATPEQRWLDANQQIRCSVVQPVQEYIEQVLFETNLANPEKGLCIDSLQAERIGKAAVENDFDG